MFNNDELPFVVDMLGTYNGSSYSRTGERGSPSAYTSELMHNLRLNNCEIRLLACAEDAAHDDPPFVRRSWNLDKPATIFRSILASKATVIHIQHEVFLYGRRALTAIIVPILFAVLSLLGKCMVVTIHGVPDPGVIDRDFAVRNGYGRLPLWLIRVGFAIIYRALGLGAHAIIVHDSEFGDRLVKNYGVCPEKVNVIPHSLPDLPNKVPRPDAVEALGLPVDKKIVLFFGYVASYKGVDRLLDAWERVLNQTRDFHLVIAGGMNSKRRDDPEYQREYAAFQRRAREIGSATWLGFVPGDKIGHLFGCTDLLVLPYTDLLSVSGPFHFAARYGVPVLCSSKLSAVVPDSVPKSELDPGTLARNIVVAASKDAPAIFTEWQAERSPLEIARKHFELYCQIGGVPAPATQPG